MRILHVSTRLILGGSQENTVLSCEGQGVQGHEVHLAFGPIYGPEGSLLDRVGRFEAGGRRIATHIVPHMVRQIAPAADRAAARELRELIAQIEPDIVHTHSSKAGILGRAAAWAVHRRRPPGRGIGIVHTIHGPPFMPVEGGVLRRAKIQLSNAVYTLAERYAARRCHLIVSVADAMTSQFLARSIGRPEQYITVRSGMEVEPFLSPGPGGSRDEVRARLGIKPSDFVVGTVARLAEHKGHDDLLDALGELLRANAGWRLLWVGDGWWRQRLADRARAMGLGIAEHDRPGPRPAGAQVILTGLVPPEEVPPMIRAMDVLAHPSYREGLPRTVPQALLCGVCPVAYDADGTGEICRDGRTGRLVPIGDRQRLREAIAWLAEHPRPRTAMAEAGRAECAREFPASVMVERLGAVYSRALEIARPGGARVE